MNDFIPGAMPHRFRAILAAMAHKNMEIPAQKLNAAFHYREVPFYSELAREMMQVLSRNKWAESRTKLRLLVNHLDLEQQKAPC